MEHNDKPWYKRIFRWTSPNVKYIVAGVVLLFGLALCSEANAAQLSVGGGISKFEAEHYIVQACTDDFKWCARAYHIGSEQRSSSKPDTQSVQTAAVFRRAQFRSTKSVRPYVVAGASVSSSKTRTQGSIYNFHTGLGVLVVKPRWFLDVGLAHDSNAGLVRPNSGRDVAFIQLGKRF